MKTSILYLLAFSIFTFFQVGVNTDNPSQTLDVNGKIEIGTDGQAPTEGSIEYRDGDFQGYDGSEWHSFTQQSNGPLPEGARPITGYDSAISVGNVDNLFFRYADGSGSFTTVPAGKYVLVTSINIQSNNLATTGLYQVTVRPFNNGSPDFNRSYYLVGDRMSISHITDPYGLLTILRPGETLQVVNESPSDFTVRASVRGFLVDDLNYN